MCILTGEIQPNSTYINTEGKKVEFRNSTHVCYTEGSDEWSGAYLYTKDQLDRKTDLVRKIN